MLKIIFNPAEDSSDVKAFRFCIATAPFIRESFLLSTTKNDH
ncbi:MAG TPA: hypothetical protein VIY08_03605 [Candidatus Nitrosocosmicus sp.]